MFQCWGWNLMLGGPSTTKLHPRPLVCLLFVLFLKNPYPQLELKF